MDNNLIVTELEQDAKSIIESLGITKERSDKLYKLIMHAFIEESRYTAMVASISRHCTHANELAYVSLVIGRLSAAKEDNDGLKGILRMFKG